MPQNNVTGTSAVIEESLPKAYIEILATCLRTAHILLQEKQ